MNKRLSSTVAIVVAFYLSAPSFAAETKTTGQSPPSFYLAQDIAAMKCQIVETRPVAGSRMKAIGTVHQGRQQIRL